MRGARGDVARTVTPLRRRSRNARPGPADVRRTLCVVPRRSVRRYRAPCVESASMTPSFREALRFWLKLGFVSFGGPAGQIAIMHRELVERMRWISEGRFLHALNYCMLPPGPEAQQLATYIGWLLHRTQGGIMAGLLFILPGIIAIMSLSYIYAAYGNVGFVEALFFGLKAAVLAIVIQAVVRIGKRALRNPTMIALAAIAFVAIFFFGAPFPLIIVGAALVGFVGARLGRPEFA